MFTVAAALSIGFRRALGQPRAPAKPPTAALLIDAAKPQTAPGDDGSGGTIGCAYGAQGRAWIAEAQPASFLSVFATLARWRGRVSAGERLLNRGQRNVNFTNDARRLEMHSRRTRKLLCKAFFDEEHPEA
jgi:hypothetical protein